MPYLEGD